MVEKSLDLSYLKNISMGNPAFELKLLKVFIEQAATEMEKINEFLQEEDWDSIYASAHKIRPSFRFIDAVEIEALLNNIEGNIKNKKNLDKLPELVNKFFELCKESIENVKKEIEKYKDLIK